MALNPSIGKDHSNCPNCFLHADRIKALTELHMYVSVRVLIKKVALKFAFEDQLPSHCDGDRQMEIVGLKFGRTLEGPENRPQAMTEFVKVVS